MIFADYGTPEFKAQWLEHWGYVDGTPEAAEAWEAKAAMMEGRHLRRAPMIFVQPDIHYQSPIDGRVIRTKHEREDDLKRNGCIEYDPEMKKDSQRRRAESDAALDRSIDESVERDFAKMPGAQRERLANELNAGVTVEPVRLTANGGA